MNLLDGAIGHGADGGGLDTEGTVHVIQVIGYCVVMPKIQFDVLVPDADSIDLAGRFTAISDLLRDKGLLSSALVVHDPEPAVDTGVEEQLRQTYRDEHEDNDLEDASVNRYLIEVDGVKGSVNQITMILARLLTPPAELPKDAFLLEQELAYEVPATYPWTVEIIR